MGRVSRTITGALRRGAPRPVLGVLRSAKRQRRRMRYRVRRVLRPVEVNRDAFVGALAEAGLEQGATTFVHSSLSRFGHVEGGPETVLSALEEALGPEALLTMPAFSMNTPAIEYVESDPLFDVRRSPSAMGALTERFRRSPGVLRSLHPTHSVCARGPGAEKLVAEHADADTPFGAGTPFEALLERGADQVWLGCGLEEAFTLYHVFECIRPGGYPIDAFTDRRFTVRCADSDGREHPVTTRVIDPTLGRRYRGAEGRALISRTLLDRGVLRSSQVGSGRIMVGDMGAIMQVLEELLQEGITWYDFDVRAGRPG